MQHYPKCLYFVLALRIVLHSAIDLSAIKTLICHGEMSLIGSTSFGFAQNTKHDFQDTVLNSQWHCLRQMPQKSQILMAVSIFDVLFFQMRTTFETDMYIAQCKIDSLEESLEKYKVCLALFTVIVLKYLMHLYVLWKKVKIYFFLFRQCFLSYVRQFQSFNKVLLSNVVVHVCYLHLLLFFFNCALDDQAC